MGYHHFVGSGLSRSEKMQLWVANALLMSKVPNESRESSIQWELKHSSGVVQIARILAQKRGVDEELAVTAAALHDIHVVINGDYTNHAKNGAAIAREVLRTETDFTEDEIDSICEAIAHHSEKHLYSSNPLIELIKDADVLDCFFYTVAGYDEKPAELRKHYFKRIIKLRAELGLPEVKELSSCLDALEGK
jgi:uncharacterized protein